MVILNPDEQGFLKAVEADPQDEATYLIYADWLDERGHPGAELLRSWRELVRVTLTEENHCRILTLIERYCAALGKVDARWLGQLYQIRPWVGEQLAEKLVRVRLRESGVKYPEQRVGPIKSRDGLWIVYYWRRPLGLPNTSPLKQASCWVNKVSGQVD